MGYSTVSLEAALSTEEAVLSEADSLLTAEAELPQAASKAAAQRCTDGNCTGSQQEITTRNLSHSSLQK